VEAVEARGLPRAVVRVPAPGGVEIAEGIGEMELGGKLVEGGCSEAFCAAARVVVGWGGEWAVGCLSGYGVLEWLRWLWGTTIHPAVCGEIKVPPKDAVGLPLQLQPWCEGAGDECALGCGVAGARGPIYAGQG
jgi:hypothetical protein